MKNKPMKSKATKNPITRRSFIKQSVTSSIATTSFLSSMASMSSVQAALAQNTSTKAAAGYKALVCIFLHGGNDGLNIIIPRETNRYNAYLNSRQNLAVPFNDLLAVSPLSGGDYGFNPAMPEIQSLFNSGSLGVQANIGTLVEPTSRTQILNGTATLPKRLFSHNDQQTLWQTAYANGSSNLGWGGQVSDYVNSMNTSPISMNISIAGNNLFQVGLNNSPYSMDASGPQEMIGVRSNNPEEQFRSEVFARIRDLSSNHILERYNGKSIKEAQETSDLLISALAASTPLATVFPGDNTLADQLKMVAQMISLRNILGFERQIFYVSLGNFDTHDRQLTDQPILLSKVSQAMASFYAATEELGIENEVTSFTLSDFGRSLTSNGDGTDHGWGSHHIVMGGAVNGGDIYGTFPDLSIGGEDDINNDGRLIPSTSVEQYSATLSRWFGLSELELAAVFPNLSNFDSSDMGFMAT